MAVYKHWNYYKFFLTVKEDSPSLATVIIQSNIQTSEVESIKPKGQKRSYKSLRIAIGYQVLASVVSCYVFHFTEPFAYFRINGVSVFGCWYFTPHLPQ